MVVAAQKRAKGLGSGWKRAPVSGDALCSTAGSWAQRCQRAAELGSLWPGLIHSWQMCGMRSKQALKAKNLLIWMMFKTMDVDIFEFGRVGC